MKSKPRRHYTPESKAQAVAMLQAGAPVSKVAQELGISDNVLYSWRLASQRAQGGTVHAAVIEESPSLDKPTVQRRASRIPRKKSELTGGDPPPRPAYRKFGLEEDWVGRNLMRRIVMILYGSELAPNCQLDLSMLYADAIGTPRKWRGYYDSKGEIIGRTKHKHIPPLDAANDLVRLALDAVTYVELLFQKEPELCQQVARRLGRWPISANLAVKDWKRDAESVVADVKLGAGIAGFLKSARTSDENPIRLFAAAIYDTLHQTHFDFKEVGANKYRTAEGCPPWAKKTLDLPRFGRATVSAWMKLGKEMLLEQLPEFLDYPLLKEQRFKWEKRAANRSRSGKPSFRAIQNEAFDDFAKEMRILAPEDDVYKGVW